MAKEERKGGAGSVENGSIPVLGTLVELRQIVRGWRSARETVALLPTMGALHEGHLALARLGKSRAHRLVTSIFVNPAQFAPHEDFDRYPRTIEADIEKLSKVGCDVVWAPDVAEMYPEGFATRVLPAGAAEGLESDFRPHFFGGVATVCCKLFSQVQPDLAVFGEKDYQQLCVIRQMVRDLNLPLEIVAGPTVREGDGLALSSRNRYLSPTERSIAPALNRAISKLAERVADARRTGPLTSRKLTDLCDTAKREVLGAGFAKIDYIAVRDAATLREPAPDSTGPLRILAAAWLGKTRLIDNVAVG
ncbi:MAG TPA: pantoate--beta-alanine ligase [Hyphomicrobiaceae bacterium]|nr:pantoate--beta-alanine ligase [Hyphomicrobiaceae bacterium]